MSAFLGPVHYWMYEKIRLKEELTEELVKLYGDEKLGDELDTAYGTTDKEPLEKIIDQSNIHGWLNERVEKAEKRFATTVQKLMEKNGGQIESLSATAKEFGRKHSIEKDSGADDTDDIENVYKAIDGMLLDGMPCAGGRRVVSKEEDSLIFEYDNAVHALCGVGEKEAEAFALIREALLEGMLEKSSFKLNPLGSSVYRISKEG